MGKRQIAASAYLSPSITANSYLQTVESPVLFVEAQVGASIKASTNLVDIVHAALLDESGLLQTKYEYPVMQDILAILFSKVLESNASISEDLVREVNKNLGNQSVYTGEIIEFVLTFAREYAEVVSAADTVAKAMSLVQSDQMTVFDAYGHIVNKILSDSVITADDRWLAFSKVNSDASIVSELYASAFGTSKSDAAAVSDLYERVAQFYRDFLSDSILLVDTADFNNGDGLEYAIGKQLSELLSVPDSYDRVVAFLRSVTDTPSVGDTSLYSLSKPIADASVSSDAYDRLCDFQRAFAEALAASESVAKGFGTWFDDSVSQTDSEIVSLNYVRSFADLVDTFISGDPLNNSLVNTFVTNASIGGELLVFAVTKVLADSQATADQFDRVVAFVREYTDLAFASEAINSFAVGKSLSDDQSQADALSWAASKPLSDAQSLEDSYSDVIGFVRDYIDAVTLVDTADFNNGDGLEYAFAKQLSHAASASDLASRVVGYDRQPSDSVSELDGLYASVSKQLSDVNQSINDSMSQAVAYARAYTDSTAESDSLFSVFAKPVTDTQPTADAISKAAVFNRAISDSAAMSDVVFAGLVTVRNVFDTVYVNPAPAGLNVWTLNNLMVGGTIGGDTFSYVLIKPIPSAQLNGPVVNKNLLNGNVIPGGG